MKKYLILLLLLIPSLALGTVVADIDVLPATTVEVGEEVFFSASDTTYDGTATLLGLARYEWDFGDGTISTIQKPVHEYSKAGTYSVILTVANGIGSNSIQKCHQ